MQCQKNDNKKAIPKIDKEEVVDQFFGKEVIDPYRNLEDLTDSIVINWLKSQKKLSNNIVNEINGKDDFLKKINSNKDKQSYTVSKLKVSSKNSLFYLKKITNEDNGKLYYKKDFLAKEVFLFDPNDFNLGKGNKYSINYIQPSWDGSKIIIGLTKNDEEFSVFKILDFETKTLLSDIIYNALPNALGGADWLKDNSGFVYTYTPSINPKDKNYLLNAESVVYYLGENKITDIFSKKNNPEFEIGDEEYPIAHISQKSDYILGTIAGASNHRDTYYQPISNLTTNNWKLLYGKERKIESFAVEGNSLYYTTSENASNFKICKVSLTSPNFDKPEILVEENLNSVITDFVITKNGLFFVRTKNGVEAELYFLNKGIEEQVAIPKPSGKINLISIGQNYQDLWIEIEGWLSKVERYVYDFKTKSFEREDLNPLKENTEFIDVIVEEIEIPSHDGVLVPLSIIYKKGIKKDNNNRLLINAYGAYKWTNSPYLYPYIKHWLEEGGVYATAHVRGGGEKGETWHKDGFKTTKANTWKDLIACTEYFIANDFTSKEKIAVWGTSAGGIGIGRAITERPDLFSIAIIRVGILNPLRLEFDAKGKFNLKEFGSVKDSIELRALLEMDPYHNIRDDVNYPALYLTAGMNDARVAAWQPAKFAARMQEATRSKKPVILDIDFDGGHGFGATTNKKNEELVNILSFAFWQTGHPDYQLKD